IGARRRYDLQHEWGEAALGIGVEARPRSIGNERHEDVRSQLFLLGSDRWRESDRQHTGNTPRPLVHLGKVPQTLEQAEGGIDLQAALDHPGRILRVVFEEKPEETA